LALQVSDLVYRDGHQLPPVFASDVEKINLVGPFREFAEAN
jgi:hypothetical protein